jgi:hypothetical protein
VAPNSVAVDSKIGYLAADVLLIAVSQMHQLTVVAVLLTPVALHSYTKLVSCTLGVTALQLRNIVSDCLYFMSYQ